MDEFILGEINGHTIVLTPSRSSAFSACSPSVQQLSSHLIAAPKKKMTMSEGIEVGVTRGKITDLVDAQKHRWIPHFFPGCSAEGFGVRIEANDLRSASRDEPHVHVLVSGTEWSDHFRRCVDDIRKK